MVWAFEMATAETMRTKLGFWGCFGEKGLERREEEIGGHLSPVNCCAKHAISICILLFETQKWGNVSFCSLC